MANFDLKHTISINNYTIHLYSANEENIDINNVNSIVQTIESTDLASSIVDKLHEINGVSKIEVFDSENKLLINSEKII